MQAAVVLYFSSIWSPGVETKRSNVFVQIVVISTLPALPDVHYSDPCTLDDGCTARKKQTLNREWQRGEYIGSASGLSGAPLRWWQERLVRRIGGSSRTQGSRAEVSHACEEDCGTRVDDRQTRKETILHHKFSAGCFSAPLIVT